MDNEWISSWSWAEKWIYEVAVIGILCFIAHTAAGQYRPKRRVHQKMTPLRLPTRRVGSIDVVSPVVDLDASTPNFRIKSNEFLELNRRIILAFQDGPDDVYNMIDCWVNGNMSLNVVNIATVLHRSVRINLKLRANDLQFLHQQLLDCPKDDETSRVVTSMLYALRIIPMHPEIGPEFICTCVNKINVGSQMSCQEAVNALCGLKGMDANLPNVRKYISFLSSQVSRVDSMSAQEVTSAVYGLQCLDPKFIEVQGLISSIVPLIKNCDQVFTANQLGNSCYGLKSLTSNHRCVRDLVSALAVKYQEVTDVLSSQNVGNAIYGLKFLSAEPLEVRQLLESLTAKIGNCQEPFNSQLIGNALYGLRSMTSDTPAVRALLVVLTKHMHTVTSLSSQAVGNCLYGLRGQSSNHPEVRNMLAVLAEKIPLCTEQPTAQEIGNSIYGLKSCSTASKEVVMVLAALLPRVQQVKEPLRTQHIGNIMYGLRSMSTDIPVVRQIISAIIPLFEDVHDTLAAQECGNSLYGMRSMSSQYPEVLLLLKVLTIHVSRFRSRLSGQEVSNALYGLNNMHSSNEEVRHALRILTPLLRGQSLNAQEVGNALHGLRTMTQCSEVIDVLVVLKPIVDNCVEPLVARNIGNAIRGLAQLPVDVPVVRDLIWSLNWHLKHMRGTLDSQSVSSILTGVGGMDCRQECLRHFIISFNVHFAEFVKPMRSNDITNVLSWMGKWGSLEGVHTILQGLYTKILTADNFTTQALYRAIVGVKQMPVSKLRTNILSALATKCNPREDPRKIKHMIRSFGDDKQFEGAQAKHRLNHHNKKGGMYGAGKN